MPKDMHVQMQVKALLLNALDIPQFATIRI